MVSRPSQLTCLAALAGSLLLQGCATVPRQDAPGGAVPAEAAAGSALASFPSPTVGSEIALRAISLLGAPYQYGGDGPSTFDCSGLVRFVHGQLGIAVPRTAAEQYSAARPVSVGGLEPGDLLFFKIRGSRVSHVAIYTGEGRFIHAPQTGRPVELRTLDDGFYRPRLVGAGRLFQQAVEKPP